MHFELIKKENITEEDRRRCLSLMTPERRAAVERISHPEVRESTVCGEWLAKSMLSRESGMPVEEIRLARDRDGKPYAENLTLFFNLSHSGEYVACAVSDRPVGLDLEVKKPRDLSVARRICSPRELEYIFHPEQTPCVNEEEMLRRFLLIWTAKEAAVKLTGIGIKGMREEDYFSLLPRLQVYEEKDFVLSIIGDEKHVL